jgi:hypothetical protein
MTMKSRRSLIISAAIIIIAVLSMYLWISGILVHKGISPVEKPIINGTPDLAKINSSLKQFPPEIQSEIQTLADTYSITPSNWGFDPFNNQIDLIAHGIHNSSATRDLEGKQIGNYTIHIFNGTELEITRPKVGKYFLDLENNPDFQIGSSEIVNDPKGPYVILWCYRLTSENKKLDNMVIEGWRIHVYVCCAGPPSPENSSKSK